MTIVHKILRALLACFMLVSTVAFANAQSLTHLRFLLDWKYQGQMGMYFLAADRGYFKAEGLDVSFDQGDGANAVAPKIASGAYDLGFGGVNSVILFNAKHPTEAPVAIFQTYNRSPFVIAVRSDSSIRQPRSLEGKTLGGPVFDDALKLFPIFAKKANIDPTKVTITNMAPNLRAQMLTRGEVDGAFGFRTGIYMDTKLMGADPDKDLRFIDYADYGMNLYSNAIIVSKSLITGNPNAIKGFLRALNHGIKDTLNDPSAAVNSVLKREPLLNAKIERERVKLMFDVDMSAPEISQIGLGDVVDSRMEKNIAIMVEANSLPRTPASNEIFDRRFLPPLSERLRILQAK